MSEVPPADAASHVLVADIEHPELDADAAHHLRRVLRVRPGAMCTATDGRGRWRWCRVGDGTRLQPIEDTHEVPRPEPPIVIAFALTKGSKPELTVQKLTELGVDRIVPFRAARSVVRWDAAKAAANHERWQAIARSAVEQSRGCWLPEIDPVTSPEAVAALGAARAERDGAPPSLARPAIAVGPEGGWDDVERSLLPVSVGLGANVLRAETAAVTAGGLLTALRSGLVAESS